MRRFRNVAPVTAGAGWIGLHVYAGHPLIAAAAAHPFVGWGIVLTAPAISILPMFARRNHALRLRSFAHWIGYATMSLFCALLVVALASDTAHLASVIAHAPWNGTLMSSGAVAAAILLTFVGLLQARRPRVVHLAVKIAELPADLRGYRIVQWSDVHVGPTIRRSFVESLVERTNALEPDAIAITGDLVDGYLDDLRDAVQPLAQLRARDGVFYVTGNHEYYWRASEWIPALQRLGLTFLKNEHRVVRDGLVIAGVTDPAGRYTHKTDVAKALAAAPADAKKILLAHRPQAANDASRYGVDLQLSGHTHGGQFFPFNLLIRWFQPVVSGLHRVGTMLLYVSRGTGYWGPPSRLGVGGEITIIELRD